MQTSLEINDLTVLVDGAGPTLVFVHGWPDGPALWESAVAALKSRHRCVRVTLPGFDLSKPPRPVSVDAMCDLLAEVVDAVSPGEPVTLVLHDWGVSLAMNLRHATASVLMPWWGSILAIPIQAPTSAN